MTHIIPDKDLEKYIQATGWVLGQEVPVRNPVNNPKMPPPVQQRIFSIDSLIFNGREFESTKSKDGKYIGLAVALQEALTEVGHEGVVASMPYLIAGKSQADKNNYLWNKWFTTFTEENAGIDIDGKLVESGKEVIITVHGGGILTPKRIMQAYNEGLTPQNAAEYTPEEFGALLKGILPSGESINLYTVDDVKNGNIPHPFSKYAVWMPGDTAKKTQSSYHSKTDFMNNPLVLARVGTQEYLESYFNKAKNSEGNVRNTHRFKDIDFKQPQGRVLGLDGGYFGLSGLNDLDDDGRFVGVVAEPHSAPK